MYKRHKRYYKPMFWQIGAARFRALRGNKWSSWWRCCVPPSVLFQFCDEKEHPLKCQASVFDRRMKFLMTFMMKFVKQYKIWIKVMSISLLLLSLLQLKIVIHVMHVIWKSVSKRTLTPSRLIHKTDKTAANNNLRICLKWKPQAKCH